MHGGLEEPEIIDLAEEKIRKKRDSGLWYVVAGVGMMFAGSISTAIAVGGAVMVIFGTTTYGINTVRLNRFQHDPWKDPELDEWEDNHFGEGMEAEGESIVQESPDDTWGKRQF